MMTPHGDMIWFEKDEPLRQCIEKVRDSGHTCFPVARSSLDQILGVVSVKNLVSASCESRLSLESIIKPAVYAANHLNALQILDRFQSSRAHMILIVDGSDVVQGLVTINDVLQAIIGFEVMDMDGPHIDKVLVQALADEDRGMNG
ncbi:MAG: CBS domain-containing protein [Desulfobacterales bacterium]